MTDGQVHKQLGGSLVSVKGPERNNGTRDEVVGLMVDASDVPPLECGTTQEHFNNTGIYSGIKVCARLPVCIRPS